MAFNRNSFGLLAAAIASRASTLALPGKDLVLASQPLLGGDRYVDRVPKVKSKGARISVSENKRRSKKKKNIKRARRLGHYTRPGRG